MVDTDGPEENAWLQALKRDPGDFSACYGLALSRLRHGDHEHAVSLLHQALNLRPGDFSTLYHLGVSLHSLGDTEQAPVHLERALIIKPGNTQTLMALALLAETRGHPEAAQGYYRKVLARDPANGRAWHALALLKSWNVADPDIQSMRHAFNDGKTVPGDRVPIGFALGRVFDTLAQHDEAFQWYCAANQQQGQAQVYDHFSQREFFGRHKRGQRQADLEHLAGDALGSNTPIFVLGMPRSGTSLVEQILASHPQVMGAGEVEYTRVLVEACEAHTERAFPLGLGDLPAGVMADAGSRYLARLLQHAGGAPRVVDKLPHNFLRVGLLATLFPHAHFILCERDPADVCLSIYQQNFSSAHAYACDLEDLGNYYRLYADLMNHWQQQCPERLHRVRYELLLNDTETQLRQLLAHCELPFDRSCLDFHQTRRIILTPSAAQVRKPLYHSSVGRFRHYEKHLGPLHKALAAID